MSKLNLKIKACGIFLLWAAAAVALPAQTLATLHSFDYTNGAEPIAGLVQAIDGNLYGITQIGGANGAGTVFKITTSGTVTTLYNFCSQGGSACTDGTMPTAGLIQATDGNFYGTTCCGGANDGGTIFQITPSGKLTTLHSFDGMDGFLPEGAVVQGTDGKFYGTASGGGDQGDGTVFQITRSGKLTTLHSFGGTDGSSPDAALVQGADGNFYGTTSYGGTGVGTMCTQEHGCGTVFKITPSGTLTTLHNFDGTDGEFPFAGLVQDTDGNLYGTTQQGGANEVCGSPSGSGCGTVFKITTTGTLTTLHIFDRTDGYSPDAGLVRGTDGNFYGTTVQGGADNKGTAFKITSSGRLKTLYTFCQDSGCADGEFPYGGLIQDTNGTFYGTTNYGGANDDGTVFSLSVGMK